MVPTATQQLLCFLRDVAKIRRKRTWAYGDNDRVLWLSKLPFSEPECDSSFHELQLTKLSSWLTVRKPQIPQRPAAPAEALDWVEGGEDQLGNFKADPPELRTEITAISIVGIEPPRSPALFDANCAESEAKTLSLADYPGIEDSWMTYLVDQWIPWSTEMQRLEGVRSAYESLDTMRRRLEEAAESYELVMAIGLLQWQDSQGKAVKRHLITAPAEIEFVADKGTISVVPAGSFDACRLEFDMLEPLDQPAVDRNVIQEKLGELGIELWLQENVGKILTEIANHHGVNSRVCMDTLEQLGRATEEFCISFAPAVVLRKRRQIAYDDLVGGFLERDEEQSETTPPWDVVVGKDRSSQDPTPGQETSVPSIPETTRYLPLATNLEQEKIIDRLEQSSAVVVKGPPGTGKSHTIANLMCHLLARGERILVTAQAPKALSVLLDKLPDEVADLCVSALASSKEDLELLKKSVAGILHRWNNWEDAAQDEEDIAKLERQRLTLQGEVQKALRAMREVREAESHNHSLPGGFDGTAAEIARQLEASTSDFAWLNGVPELNHVFPFNATQLHELADLSAELTPVRCAELDQDLGGDHLPDPKVFEAQVLAYRTALERIEQCSKQSQDSQPVQVDVSGQSESELGCLHRELQALENTIAVANRIIPELVGKTTEDLLAGRTDFYRQLITQADAVVPGLLSLVEQLGDTEVEINGDVSPTSLQPDVKRRAEHFRAGGRRGFWILKPAVVRSTDYLEKSCQVNGKPAREVAELDALQNFLQLEAGLAKLSELWPGAPVPSSPSFAIRLNVLAEVFETLRQLVDTTETEMEQTAAMIPLDCRIQLAESEVRASLRHTVDMALAKLQEAQAKQVILHWLREDAALTTDRQPHSAFDQLRKAITRCRPDAYANAWAQRVELLSAKQRRERCTSWYAKLEEICPGVAEQLEQWQGDSSARSKIANLALAFHWAAARHWLRERTRLAAWEELSKQARVQSEKLQETIESLASCRAWAVFFHRLQHSPHVLRDLTAWRQAQQRIGRGTGTYAFRHRQEARDYLMRCVSEMPAWIMPLHKVWENANANAGLFDTVIIDEASQAGIDSLLLLLLAKRIIVVGDDKQNSPEGVGVREDDLGNLVRRHLHDFPYGRTFRHDSSLFDHAERDFGNLVSLREHFRCVPEIIRFSNDEFYTDAPLVPLRQRPPDSLPPLRTTFVETGLAEGENRRIRNPTEAEEIVSCIEQCLASEQYEGKTIGVIVLQGHSQAELIEGMLRDRIDPKTIEDVKLRCGDSATFQGDQRDVIFLSMVIAPNKNYTARTTLADQRRYNVAMSRARDQVWLFHSVSNEDLSKDCLRNKLLRYLRGAQSPAAVQDFENLEWLEQQARAQRRLGEQPPPFDSWFELDVALELLRRKYRLIPQFEVMGRPKYRIDLVIEGLEGRLAVECDGGYHLEPEQIEKDLERQRQLERAGWEFVRLPESEFYTDRTASLKRIEEKCVELGILPLTNYDPHDEESSSSAESVKAEECDGLSELNAQESSEALEESQPPTDPEVLDDPFTGYNEDRNFPDPREAATTNIRQALMEIIERDGPLSFSSIIRLYREGCPALGRAARVVRSEIRKALGVMKRMQQVEMEVELQNGSEDGMIYRVSNTSRIRERAAGGRKMEEVPPSEIISVLNRNGADLSDTDESWRIIQEVYGFQRLTAPRREYLENVTQSSRQATTK